MTNDKRFFRLENAKGVLLGIGWRDHTGVYFSVDAPKRYENFDTLLDENGAGGLRYMPYVLPIPEELFTVPYGIPGLTRSEGVLYMILETANDYVPRDEIMRWMQVLVGSKGDAFYAIVSRLRKKMPHDQSIEMKRGKGYKLEKS